MSEWIHLPHRVHLEGWDLAAACVQRHMSAVGVRPGAACEEGHGQAQQATGVDAASRSGRDGVAGHAATEQRLVQLDAPQMRLVIVANELSREGGFEHRINGGTLAWLFSSNMLAAASQCCCASHV